MCSSLLGLGGTHVQQAFRSRRNICAAVFCVLLHSPPYLCAVFPNVQKQLNMSLLSYMSYQNHVGLQPANLVTSPTISCSRRVLFRCSVFFVPYVGFALNFIPIPIPVFFFSPRLIRTLSTELQYGLPTSVTYRTRYFRTLNSI